MFPIIIYPASSTVYYGTRTLSREVFIIPGKEYNEFYGVHQSVNDTCPSNFTQCDGIKDCQLGTDETYCGEYALTKTSLAGLWWRLVIKWQELCQKLIKPRTKLMQVKAA